MPVPEGFDTLSDAVGKLNEIGRGGGVIPPAVELMSTRDQLAGAAGTTGDPMIQDLLGVFDGLIAARRAADAGDEASAEALLEKAKEDVRVFVRSF